MKPYTIDCLLFKQHNGRQKGGNMSDLILIRGPICAGKSTVVKELRRLLPEASAIDFDAFKLQLDNQQSSDWRRQAALRVALFMAFEVAARGRTMLVDIPSSKVELLKVYQQLAEEVGYRFKTFLLLPPLQTCLERNQHRPIPEACYRLEPALIESFWNETVFVPNELVFDTSIQSAKDVAGAIVKEVSR